MPYLRSFAPWIVYAAVSSVTDWRVAAIAAVVVAGRAVTDQRRQYGAADDLTLTTLVFFAGLSILSLLRPDSMLHHFTPALSLAALGLASVASLVRGRPFTLTIAKRTTARELWDLPAFVDANVTITTVWAASFLATAAVCATVLAVAPHATPVWVTAEILGFIIPVKFTAAYRERVRARFAAA